MMDGSEGRQGLLPRAEEQRATSTDVNDDLFDGQLPTRRPMPTSSAPSSDNIGNILYVTLALRRRRVCCSCGRAEPVALRHGRHGHSASLSPFLQHGDAVHRQRQPGLPADQRPSSWRWRALSASSPLIDEKPETDDGYVTLVNAEEAPDGTADRNRPRAPAIGHGSTRTATAPSPIPSCAVDVRLTDVDFAYTEGKDRAA